METWEKVIAWTLLIVTFVVGFVIIIWGVFDATPIDRIITSLVVLASVAVMFVLYRYN